MHVSSQRKSDVEMNDDERRIAILYGSETGTAQDVAKRIERDAIRCHFSVTIKPLDHYDVVCIVRNYCWCVHDLHPCDNVLMVTVPAQCALWPFYQ